tara:strand:+ start:10570 stop:11625 length:1056 start_codon:yes stop_codon:yes gene_type:complete
MSFNKNLLIGSNDTILTAIKKLNEVGEKTLIVVNKQKKYLGTLSDGDIRRNIVENFDLKAKITNIYNKKSIFFYNNYKINDLKKIFKTKKTDLLPILSKNKNILKVIFWNDLLKENYFKKNTNLTNVIIMAGGKGVRLKPLSETIPKPLIPFNNKAIIDHIIESFTNKGFINFLISTNYKKKIIKSYLSQLTEKINIKYLDEDKPLGTVGIIHKLNKKIKKPFFLTNCDTLINFNYNTILKNHISSQAKLTIVVVNKNYQIPYGSCTIDKNKKLLSITEKPSIKMLVNTGLYILDPEIIKYIPKNKFFNIDTLIKKLIQKKQKINTYLVNESKWFDFGSFDQINNSKKIFK